MAKEKGEGFSSSAGLMRYFDSEDNKGLKLSREKDISQAEEIINQ